MFHYKNTRTLSLLAALLAIFSAQLFAATPRPINYQGYLTQPDGTPIDTPVALVVSLWTDAAAGTLLFSESHSNVPVSKGRFSVRIGSGSLLAGTFTADQFTQDTWLELTVNGEVMSPRSELGAVASAQHAVIAERLTQACADGELLSFQGGLPVCVPACFDGDRVNCYDGSAATRDHGVCRSGVRECASGVFGACANQVLPVPENCNLLDDDCDGEVDEGNSIPGCENRYLDADADGYGEDSTLACICANPGGPTTSASGGDCDDNDANVSPGQTAYFQQPNNLGNFDYNCNGIIETNYPETVASCTYNGSSCDYVSGFVGSVPPCGSSGSVSNGCTLSGTSCTVNTAPYGLSMRCR